MKRLLIFLTISTNAYAFGDKNDYTSVKKAFETETPPLFNYIGNKKFCKRGTLYTIPYTKLNTGATSMVGESGKLKAHFFAVSFGHAIASYLEGELKPDLSYKKEEFINKMYFTIAAFLQPRAMLNLFEIQKKQVIEQIKSC